MISDHEKFNRALAYSPGSGILTWKHRDEDTKYFNPRFSGKEAGRITKDGYISIRLNKKDYYAHRVLWLLTHGAWPINSLDHINGNKSDNRISNLRESNPSEQMLNRAMPSNNTSGVHGVTMRKDSGKWQASIQVHKESIYLGLFSSLSEAKSARCAAEQKYGFHANHGRTKT